LAAQDFVRSCLNKDPRKRPTYEKLLSLPWLASMSKIQTITEEAEDEDDIDGAVDAIDRLGLHSGTDDPEVAEWVKGVLDRKKAGLIKDSAMKPALHAAPLDSISPASSPQIGSEPPAGMV
jgi:mitogen-activated protein kinase kinase